MRSGWLAIGAVNSSARSHACAGEPLGLGAVTLASRSIRFIGGAPSGYLLCGRTGINCEHRAGDVLGPGSEQKLDGARHVFELGKTMQCAALRDLFPVPVS